MARRRNMRSQARVSLIGLFMLGVASSSIGAAAPAMIGVGPNPQLPPPRPSLIPTVNIAPAEGWKDGRMPAAAQGFQVAAFARGLTHPRWLYVLPNGDVLVAETNGPGEPT